MNKKFYILGAGPIGLVTAWKLLENGFSVEVVEKLDRVGGMCRTWKWRDFLVDTGPHIYHTPDKNLADFWEKEFGDLFIKSEFWCQNVRGKNFNEYWDYPISWQSISKYPKSLRQKVVSEIESRQKEGRAKANSYQQYIDSQVGPTLRKMFFDEYPEKVWGIPTTSLTPEWAPKRIELREKTTPFYHQQWNAVGRYGTGCVYERISDMILGLGGKIRLNSEVKSIIYRGKDITGVKLSKGKDIKINSDDRIISSLPINLTAYFFGYKSKLQFRGICSVYLAFDKEQVIPGRNHWLYYGSPRVVFNRVTEPKKMSPDIAPPDQTYLVTETTFSRGDDFDSLSDQHIFDTVIEGIETVGLAKANEVVGFSINKEYFVYPIQYTGYQEELAKTKSAISQFDQLFSLGTGGDFNYADSQILFHKALDLVDSIVRSEKSNSLLDQELKRVVKCTPNQIVDINGKKIGDGQPAYIIAEAGLNHNGSLKLAKTLVDKAAEAGCDAVKFQTYRASNRVSSEVKSVKYAESTVGLEENLLQVFEKLEMSFGDQKKLFSYARRKQIEIFSTPFDTESADFLDTLGVSMFKIASMDLVNLPLISHIAKKGKPIILSTGMSSLAQVDEAVNCILEQNNSNIILLQCNSSYPAAPEDMNLEVINTYKQSFRVPAGLSDHTFGLFVSTVALVMGANVIERHFTLDKGMEGPDHILSSEPEEMGDLVRIAKQIPLVRGSGIKTIQPDEYFTLNAQRKSLYAGTDIKAGQRISKDMVSIKGPGGGLLPKYLSIVIGKKAQVDVPKDHPLTWEAI
ncbi:MAG: N-acetylneuraminate synthase [Candidatus Pacebacteria bacterium CG10_big_fil_rev_8_21_14_0_10_56_10]|nr:MAG: N-acetylneuraminate synthase [Candidatus Pacebacteria bacterium CG10_big_fil_rev_8_21_14_0_10_56_10]